MICETCHGEGWEWADSIPAFGIMPGDPDKPPAGASLRRPCRGCGGTGIASCCEGAVGNAGDVTNCPDTDTGRRPLSNYPYRACQVCGTQIHVGGVYICKRCADEAEQLAEDSGRRPLSTSDQPADRHFAKAQEIRKRAWDKSASVEWPDDASKMAHFALMIVEEIPAALADTERAKDEEIARTASERDDAVDMLLVRDDDLNQAKAEIARLNGLLLKPNDGHGELCRLCGVECSSYAGNPGKWPIYFPSGTCCRACVTKRLNDPAHTAGFREGIEAAAKVIAAYAEEGGHELGSYHSLLYVGRLVASLQPSENQP